MHWRIHVAAQMHASISTSTWPLGLPALEGSLQPQSVSHIVHDASLAPRKETTLSRYRQGRFLVCDPAMYLFSIWQELHQA